MNEAESTSTPDAPAEPCCCASSSTEAAEKKAEPCCGPSGDCCTGQVCWVKMTVFLLVVGAAVAVLVHGLVTA